MRSRPLICDGGKTPYFHHSVKDLFCSYRDGSDVRSTHSGSFRNTLPLSRRERRSIGYLFTSAPGLSAGPRPCRPPILALGRLVWRSAPGPPLRPRGGGRPPAPLSPRPYPPEQGNEKGLTKGRNKRKKQRKLQPKVGPARPPHFRRPHPPLPLGAFLRWPSNPLLCP